jgi:Flp pilus assembly pilin Flp
MLAHRRIHLAHDAALVPCRCINSARLGSRPRLIDARMRRRIHFVHAPPRGLLVTHRHRQAPAVARLEPMRHRRSRAWRIDGEAALGSEGIRPAGDSIMRRKLKAFAANDQGTAALEYGLLTAGIALAFIVAFLPIWGELAIIAQHVLAGLVQIVAMGQR